MELTDAIADRAGHWHLSNLFSSSSSLIRFSCAISKRGRHIWAGCAPPYPSRCSPSCPLSNRHGLKECRSVLSAWAPYSQLRRTLQHLHFRLGLRFGLLVLLIVLTHQPSFDEFRCLFDVVEDVLFGRVAHIVIDVLFSRLAAHGLLDFGLHFEVALN